MKKLLVLVSALSFFAGSAEASPAAPVVPPPAAPTFRPCTSEGFGPAFAAADEAFNLGQAAADAGRHQEAIGHFQKAIALNPNDACAYNNLGVEQEEMGLPDQAMKSYDAAITLDPSLDSAWENRGNLWLDRGETERADLDFAHADLAAEFHSET